MPVSRWRTLKGLLYVLLMAAVAIAGLRNSAPIIVVSFITASLLVYGIEVKEIEVANWVSITFVERGTKVEEEEGE